MWPVLIGCVIGAVMMGRTKPQAKSHKRELIGPNTGNTYRVDDFPSAGIIIVHGPACVCSFIRTPSGRFAFVQALGHTDGIRVVCSDLDPALLRGPSEGAQNASKPP